MSNNRPEQQLHGTKLQKWLAVHVEKGRYGYGQVAAKFGCKEEKADLESVIYRVFTSRDRAKEIIDKLEQNQEYILKGKNRPVKKSRARRMLNAEAAKQDDVTILERKVRSIQDRLNYETDCKVAAEAKLQELLQKSEQKKSEAATLYKQIKQIAAELDEIETEATTAVADLEEITERVNSLERELAECSNKLDEAKRIHVTISPECVSDECKLLPVNMVTVEKINECMIHVMTHPEEFPEDFREFLGIATMDDVRLISKVMAMSQELGEKAKWHFPKSDTVTELLQFAGFDIVLDSEEADNN